MCTNTRLIYNRYIKSSLRVDCGRCPACLQKKANKRSQRIKDNMSLGYIALFVTLTYRNDFVPYVLKDDVLAECNTLTIYRESTIRKVRKDGKYRIGYKFCRQCYEELAEIHVDYKDDWKNKPLHSLNGCPSRIGVCYYPDVQNFVKRLSINLKRNYHYHEKLSLFICAEYGSKTSRPHFHILLFIPRGAQEVVRSAVLKSWPFDDYGRKKKCVEVARDAASYVASYVNSSAALSSFYQNRSIRSKHSYSKYFGFGFDSFRLDKILTNLRNGVVSYDRQVKREGKIDFVTLPLPHYVINRYFPWFKGCSRIDVSSLDWFIRNPSDLFRLSSDLDYSHDDLHRIFVRLKHAFEYYHVVTGFGIYDYAFDYVLMYNTYKSYILRHQYDVVVSSDDFGFFYDNLNEYFYGHVKSLSLDGLDLNYFEHNPNRLPWRVSETNYYDDLFIKKDKTRKVLNLSMSQMGFNV